MRLIVLCCAALLGACAHAPKAAPDPTASPQALFAQRYPLSPEQRATTASSIYLANLDARIDVLDAELVRGDNPAVRGNLAGALLLRFRIIGRISDGERALQLAGEAAASAPELADLQVVHAAALSAFHRFAPAQQALARARTAGAAQPSLATLQRD
ncbi:MAG TPA: hypothetical protein VN259_02815, partial [Xanthomonadales bacterium]|nr:hypothetical protein [Xanthomonadales bacterium]